MGSREVVDSAMVDSCFIGDHSDEEAIVDYWGEKGTDLELMYDIVDMFTGSWNSRPTTTRRFWGSSRTS